MVKKRHSIKKNKNTCSNNYKIDFEQDETFAFIAGYTEGGAPYGITWEECGEIENGEHNEGKENTPTKIKYNDLPF